MRFGSLDARAKSLTSLIQLLSGLSGQTSVVHPFAAIIVPDLTGFTGNPLSPSGLALNQLGSWQFRVADLGF